MESCLLRTNQLQIMSCVNCEKIKRETHWGPIQKTKWQSPKLLMGLTHSELPQIQTLLSLFNQDTLFKRRLCNAALMQDLTKYHMMPHLKGLFSFSFAWLALSLQKECLQKGWFGWYDAIGTEWWTRSKAAKLWNHELTQTSRDFVTRKFTMSNLIHLEWNLNTV